MGTARLPAAARRYETLPLQQCRASGCGQCPATINAATTVVAVRATITARMRSPFADDARRSGHATWRSSWHPQGGTGARRALPLAAACAAESHPDAARGPSSAVQAGAVDPVVFGCSPVAAPRLQLSRTHAQAAPCDHPARYSFGGPPTDPEPDGRIGRRGSRTPDSPSASGPSSSSSKGKGHASRSGSNGRVGHRGPRPGGARSRDGALRAAVTDRPRAASSRVTGQRRDSRNLQAL
jgi:hypothetical protein